MDFLKYRHLALCSLLPATNALTGQQIAAYFEQTLSPATEVYLPGNSNYSEVTPRWDAYSPPIYVVAVKPASDNDIQKIIQYATQNEVSFLATGSGHGYTTTLDSVENGIEIDLSNFNQIDIDVSTNTVTLGGGLHFGEITGPLYDAGKELQVGADTCVGVMGATLGGGTGPYSGIHGLTLDALQSVDMITGTGEMITASTTDNTELFWGVRGAGFNFGIVISATFQVFNLTNNGMAVNADFIFPISSNGSIWEYVHSFQDNPPDNIFLSPGIGYNATLGAPFILFNIVYIGPMSEALEYVQPLIGLQPLRQNITSVPYKDVESSTRFGLDTEACITGRMHSVYSLNLYTINTTTLVDVTNFLSDTWTQQPALQEALLAFDLIPNRIIKSFGEDSTAYPWRNAIAYVHFDVAFANDSDTNAANQVGQEVRNMLLATSGASSIEVYVNYAHGDEGETAWYGRANLERLHALKQQYDPHHLFIHYNGLGY